MYSLTVSDVLVIMGEQVEMLYFRQLYISSSSMFLELNSIVPLRLLFRVPLIIFNRVDFPTPFFPEMI